MTATHLPEGGNHALLGFESTVQYDQLIGAFSLDSLKPILHAQVLALDGDAAQALPLFDAHIAGQPEGMARLQCAFLGDRAWCLAELGRLDEARIAAQAAIAGFTPESQADDRAATHSRLAQVFEKLGDADNLRKHQDAATLAWEEFGELQAEIYAALKGLSEFPSVLS